jgi:release factor glutamine methyltransferase
MTVLQALQWGNQKTKAMLDVEVLLSAAFGQPKNWLFTHFDAELSENQLDTFRKFVERRLKHEPVAYIIGRREFYGRLFEVNRFVLIPRPETEILVENAVRFSQNAASDDLLFLDVGTGSGAIGLTLAAETGRSVVATDQSREALVVAKQNCERMNLGHLVDFLAGDLLEPFIALVERLQGQNHALPDQLVICANLPYLTQYQWISAMPDILEFEPKEALAAGPDGLDVYFRLFRQLRENRALLPSKIEVLIEIDPQQTKKIITLIRHDFPQVEPKIIKDLAGLDRVIQCPL